MKLAVSERAGLLYPRFFEDLRLLSLCLDSPQDASLARSASIGGCMMFTSRGDDFLANDRLDGPSNVVLIRLVGEPSSNLGADGLGK